MNIINGGVTRHREQSLATVVELEGFEPSSRQSAHQLSTCLVFNLGLGAGQERKRSHVVTQFPVNFIPSPVTSRRD